MRERHVFQPRECWLCGQMMNTREEVDFFLLGDAKGVCKDHHIKDILSVKSKYNNMHGGQLKEYQNKGLQLACMNNTFGIKKKIKIIIKNKIPSKMRKLLINLFIFVVGIEIIIHLPHLFNVLINKIK